MKIKNIFSKKIACVLLTVLAAVSCTDDNDWSTDPSLSRLFGVKDNISVTSGDTYAEITFGFVPEATHYIIELSTDPLSDEVPMGGPNAIVFGEDGSLRQEPGYANMQFTASGLRGDTEYYLRVKARSDHKTESRWVYYKEGESFKTLAEQVFNIPASTDISDEWVRLSWNTDNVTNILVQVPTDQVDEEGETILEVVQNIQLTDEIRAAREYTVTGLQGSTSYIFTIMNGDVKRGTLNISTAAPMPAGNLKYELPAMVTTIDNAMLEDLFAQAKELAGSDNASVTIGLPGGSTIELSTLNESGEISGVRIPEGMSVTFFGMPGDTPTLIVPKSMNIDGSHNFINFENLKITEKSGANYLINQGKACNIDGISFKSCELFGFGNTPFRLQGSDVKVIKNLTIDNCLIHDISLSGGYSMIHIDAGSGKGYVSNILIQNTTVYNVKAANARCIVQVKDTDMESCKFINCTFRNILGGGRYFFDSNGTSKGTASPVLIENCLFGHMNTKDTRGGRNKTDFEVVNSYVTYEQDGCFWHEQPVTINGTEYPKTANAIKGFENLEMADTEIFADPSNNDFTIKNESVKNMKIGDPRWW